MSLIHGLHGQKNRLKIRTEEQQAVMDRILSKNLDNEQTAELYNKIAVAEGWDTISAGTVANRLKDIELMAFAAKHGKTEFMNRKAMQVKRSAPSAPMLYWSIDGWVAELLYQKENTDKQGRKTITYHNRLTMVIVLDAYNKYPVGYAVGEEENTELIKSALRDALRNTKRLFGRYYKPYQIQSDRFGGKTLSELYTESTVHYTPARAKNAKSKVVEPYNRYINKLLQKKLLPNWSGFGVTAKKDSQPNAELINLMKKDFPDATGCAAQLHAIMAEERAGKEQQYVTGWRELTKPEHKTEMGDGLYLSMYGETNCFRNSNIPETKRLESDGFCPTILRTKREYDTFDARFRELSHIDWVVKYDAEDLTHILAESKDGRYQFVLQEKYVQPMALADRKDGDAAEWQKVKDFNKNLENTIIEKHVKDTQIIQELRLRNPSLDILEKLCITDSRGQHKKQKQIAAQREPKRLEPALVPTEEDYEVIMDDYRNMY